MDELPGQTKPNKELSYVLSFLQNRFDRLAAIPVCPENESQLREEIHLLLTLSHLCAASADQTQKQNLAHLTQGCHNILRKLENLMLCHAHVFPFESCAFVSFLDDICCACDLLLSGCGKRVLFDADLHLQAFSYDPGHSGLLPNGYDKCALFHIGTPEALVACAPGPVRTALLNLIANAALHSQSTTILVRLSCTPSHMLVTVRSAGETSLYALQRERIRPVQACAPCAGARSCIKARSSSKVMNTVRRRRLPCRGIWKLRRKRIPSPNRILWNISVTG